MTLTFILARGPTWRGGNGGDEPGHGCLAACCGGAEAAVAMSRYSGASLFAALLSAVALAGCARPVASSANSGARGDDRPSIVVTTNVLGDVVRTVAGDAADVEVLMAPGTDPHSFEPSAKEAGLLREADLVVANGLGLEAALAGTLESAAADGVPVLRVGEHVDPIPFGGETEPEETHDDGHANSHRAGVHTGDDHGGPDPHFWMDPVRMADAVEVVGRELSTVYPAGDWSDRAEAYVTELHALDEEIRRLLAPIPEDRRQMVTNHDAFSYFTQRYGLQEVGTVIPAGTTLAEPSAADLEALVTEIREHEVPAIFVDTTASNRLAQAVADEVGIRVVELYSGSLDGDDPAADTYLDMMRTNAERIAEALAG